MSLGKQAFGYSEVQRPWISLLARCDPDIASTNQSTLPYCSPQP